MGEARPDLSSLGELAAAIGLHEHRCLIYENEEQQFASALPFLTAGLQQNERCLYIADENSETAVLGALRKAGTDVDHFLHSGALVLTGKRETYLRLGHFDPDLWIQFLAQSIQQAGDGRFSGLRTLLGEMTWALGRETPCESVIEYEAKLNYFVRDHEVRVLCQYHRPRFSPELILGIIRTHPVVVYGGLICQNPYYVPPEELLKPNGADREVGRLLHNIQEWEQTKQALRQSEDHLRLVIDTIPTMAWSTRPDGTVDFLNQRWMDYAGLSLEQFIKEPTGPIHPEDIPGVMEKWRAAEAVGEPYEAEMRLRRADGEYRWFLVRTVPLRDDRGNVVKWYGSCIDIEDRKRAGEQLRASEERWRAVFENSAVGLALTDPQGKYVGSNRAYQEMVGYTDEELRRMSYLDITFEEDRKISRDLSSELWEGKRRQFQLEKRYRRKDGARIWVRATTSAAPDAQGKSRFGMAIVEDITERKRAEEALRRSEAYLAAGQGLSHTGSWALNVFSGELFWSQETFSIFGFDPASTTPSINETFLPRIHPEDRPKVEAGLNASEIQKGSYGVDYRIVLPDGSIRYIHDVVYPAMNEAGTVVERYGVIMDVTERRRTEVELQESRDQLRALAARLQMAREEERKRVAREIHDELGQALTAIKIELSSLLFEWPAEQKPSRRAESIARLVDTTIQSVRRISTELRPGILDALGLAAAVEWAAEEFQTRTGTRCRVDLPNETIEVDQDLATTVFRILQEALTNIARHADATQVDIRLESEGGRLSLEVRDNGKGISGEQVSGVSSLGILGMRERVLLLGGTLDISSTMRIGTTVRVLIPDSAPSPSRQT
jgi:PAS domain S-box-containing protein